MGEPKWVASAKVDILTKPDAVEVAALQNLTEEQRTEQIRQMVQGLLAERFKLKTRMLAVYALTVAKNGSKMTPSKTVSDSKDWTGITGGPGHLEGRRVPLRSSQAISRGYRRLVAAWYSTRQD